MNNMKKQTLVGTKLFGECEACEGTALQIQDAGAMKGMIRPCPKCGRDWQSFKNQYGRDENDGHPDVYIDTDKGILAKVNKGKDHILLNDKEGKPVEIELEDHNPITEKFNN